MTTKLLDRRWVNPWDGDMSPHPEDREHDESKDDLISKFGNLEDVAKGCEHLTSPQFFRSGRLQR